MPPANTFSLREQSISSNYDEKSLNKKKKVRMTCIETTPEFLQMSSKLAFVQELKASIFYRANVAFENVCT